MLLCRVSGWSVCFLPGAFLLISGSGLQATPYDAFMTLLMTLSWRFLLILAPERMECVIWVAARNPAGWAFKLGNALEE